MDAPLSRSHLDSVLRQLQDAPDPAAFALGHGLMLRAGRVRVIVEADADEGDLARVHDLQVEARYAGLILVFAPVRRLRDLASDPRIRSVRSSSRAHPDRG